MQYVKLIVSGRVQGVFYRVSCKRKAIGLNITGFVKNLGEDSVQIIAKGTPANIKEFIFWCKIGSEMSNVMSVTQELVDLEEDYNNFEILH